MTANILTDTLTACYNAGIYAFEHNGMRAPALDPTVMAAVATSPVGAPWNTAVMSAFTRGWDAACVAAVRSLVISW